jgi:Ca-activated chloride channel family protein
MTPRILAWLAALLAVAAVALFGWGRVGGPHRGVELSIVSGSENRPLDALVQDWARREGAEVSMTWLGSVDIAREIEKGAAGAHDAVWPAHSLWIEFGDAQRVVKHDRSILRSPVALGLRRSIAARLGWIGRDDVTVQDIAAAAESGAFRLAMTSASQSNSGASAYLGFLYAFAGDPDLLTLDHLADPQVRARATGLFASVDRSAGSSGWLGEAFVAHPDRFDAMINYESVLIETNRALVAAGREPLHVVYPANGLAVADSPLGYVEKGDARREAAFLSLQAHLLSPPVQAELFASGRRAGLLGVSTTDAPPAVWNADWGLDPSREIAPVPMPAREVIREALRLYQTALRKPSFTVWVLDVSGSMEGAPLAALKQAMALVLDPERAALLLLDPAPGDATVVIPFSDAPRPARRIDGADGAALRGLLAEVAALEAGGGTDLYAALGAALAVLEAAERDGSLAGRLPAIIALTDGASDETGRAALLDRLQASAVGRDTPIHAIAIGEADERQLSELNDRTVGRLFRAGDDIAGALRGARGYN